MPLPTILGIAFLIIASLLMNVSFAAIGYLVALVMLYLVVSSKPASPLIVMTAAWSLCFVNVFLGPLDFPDVGSWTPALVYLLGYFSFFALPYSAARAQSVQIRNDVDVVRRYGRHLKACAFLGIALLVLGGTLTALPYLTRLDFAALRGAFIENVNIFTQVGWIALWPAYILLIPMSYRKRVTNKIETWLLILGLLAIPLFSAGRQIYLQMILLTGIAASLRKSSTQSKGVSFRLGANNSDLRGNLGMARKIGVLAVMAVAAVTIFRFDPASRNYFDNELGMYQHYSSVRLAPAYETTWNKIPVAVRDLVTEVNYYMGAQLVRFVEVLNNQSFPSFGFNVIGKVPFLERNLDRIVGPSLDPVPAPYVGQIAGFTWRTSIPADMESFGLVGSLLVSGVVGWLSGLSYRAVRLLPSSLEAANFAAANGALVFYSTMFSVMGDTHFFFYYLASLAIFFFKFRIGFRRLKRVSLK